MARFSRFIPVIIIVIIMLLALVLNSVEAQSGDDPLNTPVKLLVPEVITVRAHDPGAYTQGFLIYDGLLYESTGLNGQSTLRQVDPETGEVLKSIDISEEYFAEGLERIDDTLIQLTWKSEVAFVYDLDTFEQIGRLTYGGEGWGLCTDGQHLYMSNGSPFIAVRDIDSFDLIFNGLVTLQSSPVVRLNELECVGDYIYANVWHTDFILKIDKSNGVVVAVIDATGLLSPEEIAQLGEQDVLNGIAYLPDSDTFLITGKRWPKMFEVRFVEVEE